MALRHLLSIEETEDADVRLIMETARSFQDVIGRPVKKVPALRGRTVVTLFYEASTRTRTSFELAAKYLSADAVNIAVAQSSVTKGESLKDTVRTLEAVTADCVVMRHSSSGAPHLAAGMLGIPVINAGDGRHEHPTQALLDAVTIWDAWAPGLGKKVGVDAPDFSGLRVAIVGDVAHSRVARSNAWLLSRLGAEVRFVGPTTLMPADASLLPATVHSDLRAGIEGAHVVMVLRLQTERQEAGLLPTAREYSRIWGVNRFALAAAHPDALVMHPGPMNRGVEIAPDVADGLAGHASAIETQVRNGVAVRMACLYLLMGSAAGDVL